MTQLPDHVIAERCQNAAEKRSMHIRQKEEERNKGYKDNRVKEGENQEVSSEAEAEISLRQA